MRNTFSFKKTKLQKKIKKRTQSSVILIKDVKHETEAKYRTCSFKKFYKNDNYNLQRLEEKNQFKYLVISLDSNEN